MSFEIISTIARDESTAYAFLKQNRCIRSSAPQCDLCDRRMTWVKAGPRGQFMWRCPTHKGHKLTVRSGSFWENSKLSLSKHLQLAFFWSYEIPNKTCEELTDLNTQAVSQWYRMFRNVSSNHLSENPVVIGGRGVIVELGDYEIPRRRVKRPNNDDDDTEIPPERWVFGGFCPSTEEGFVVIVPDIRMKTILPIIQKHVLPGSIIHTDEWTSYDTESVNVIPPYTHRTVENAGCYAEDQWKIAKEKFNAMYGVHPDSVGGYLDEFQWRKKYGQSGMDAFNNLISQISELYPVQ